jgi:hypothetical protein
MLHRVALILVVLSVGCGPEPRRVAVRPSGASGEPGSDAGAEPGGDAGAEPVHTVDTGLFINELMASNDGAYIDEHGEVDDWIELVNRGGSPIALDDFALADGKGKNFHDLPQRVLMPGERVVLWADDQPDQGALHLPFKLSKERDTLSLRRRGEGTLADYVRFDALVTNESVARFPDGFGEFARCRLATPAANNGEACEDALAQGSTPQDAPFADYAWPSSFPARPKPLAISELALKPAAFVELENASAEVIELDDWALVIAPHKPGQPWPDVTDGVAVPLPLGATIPARGRYVLPLTESDLTQLASDPAFEGVVSLFRQGPLGVDTELIDRVDFMQWPAGAVLSRRADRPQLRFCTNATRGEPDDCRPLLSRPVGDRLRHLYTPSDFAALAQGGTSVGMAPVKFVIEGQGEGPVHLLGSARWPLHFTFTREVVDGQPAIDRCTADGASQFDSEFSLFMASEYFNVVSRRYLLGTLVHHVGPDLHTVEFTSGDLISAEQMKLAFFSVAAQTDEPTRWSLRATDAELEQRMRMLEGQLPIVGQNAPYRGLRFQLLTAAVGFGTLTFIPSEQLATARLGPRVIVVTDAVPNDIPFSGGLITEAFQTPLAHVNLLSQARDAPNMALAQARRAPELEPFFGKLVRFEVTADGFSVRAAGPVEAQSFWDAQKPDGPAFVPRVDRSVRGVVSLAGRGIADLPIIGAKAAQLAELARVDREYETEGEDACAALPIVAPEAAFAVPVVHYLEHFAASGAEARLDELEATASFREDPTVRSAGLTEVRARLTDHPLDANLRSQVELEIARRFADKPVRFRSSSNAEDLVGFNGAGLYESESSLDLAPEEAIKTVWASLWSDRAYDERAYGNLSRETLAMAVLVHPAFRSERANGVAMSRNLLDLTRSDQFYINAQQGEAAVTNPAPNVASDQLIYTWPPFTPTIAYQTRSSFTQGRNVLSDAEVRRLVCTLGAIHEHFKRLLDPEGRQRWFTMEIEFKIMGDARTLAVKQARPFPFSTARLPADCRGE